jgi:hypothetical protein
MKVECSKDQLPLLGGRQDEKYAGKIEAIKTASAIFRKGRVISQRAQPSTRQQNRQSTGSKTGSQQGSGHSLPQDSRTGSQQALDTAFQESRIIENAPSARSGNQQAKGGPKKPECLEDDRPTQSADKLTVKQDNQLGKLEKVKRSERRKR